jgi:LacI family transcriptional regulator
MGPQDIWSFEGRARGFRDTILAAGASCQDVRTTLRLPTAQAGREVVSELLAQQDDRPTAIFAHNDSIAIGALGVFRDHDLECPDDISVIGYNDVPLTAHINPPLTTIRLPGYELGRLAAELVITPSGGADTAAGKVQLAPELVVRASTGPPAVAGGRPPS